MESWVLVNQVWLVLWAGGSLFVRRVHHFFFNPNAIVEFASKSNLGRRITFTQSSAPKATIFIFFQNVCTKQRVHIQLEHWLNCLRLSKPPEDKCKKFVALTYKLFSCSSLLMLPSPCAWCFHCLVKKLIFTYNDRRVCWGRGWWVVGGGGVCCLSHFNSPSTRAISRTFLQRRFPAPCSVRHMTRVFHLKHAGKSLESRKHDQIFDQLHKCWGGGKV